MTVDALPAITTSPRAPLPQPRGPLSQVLHDWLRRAPDTVEARAALAAIPEVGALTRTITDEDVQLCLLLAHELHHAGWDGVDDAWEWDPALVAWLRPLEQAFERDLRALVDTPLPDAQRSSDALFALAAADEAPSLSKHVALRATRDQVVEYLQHRSLVQLKEADAQTWLVPRLRGTGKGVLLEVQDDEYGGGDLTAMHSRLWAQTMRAAGLSDVENGYVDVLPAVSLAILNAQTLFGLHKRLAPAGVGFFTMVEITSSAPMRRYARGLERLGFGPDATAYFLEHVEADAVHEQLMTRELVDAWVAVEPDVADDILLGAKVCLALDGLLAAHLLDAWAADRSSLRTAA